MLVLQLYGPTIDMGHNMSNIKNIVCNVSVSLQIRNKKFLKKKISKEYSYYLTKYLMISTTIAFELPLFYRSTTFSFLSKKKTFSLKNHDTHMIS